MGTILPALIGALASVLVFVGGFFLSERQSRLKAEFDRRQAVFVSNRAWKEKSVGDLLGPVCMQLDRSKRAFDRWNGRNEFLEAKVVGEANRIVRDALLKLPHLIPPERLGDAQALIEHYDRWLEEFERIRSSEKPALDQAFVFAGPAGFPFPVAAERNLRQTYEQYWRDLYGPPPAA